MTKDLINKFSIPKRAKLSSSGIFQKYLVFIPAKKYMKFLSGTILINSWKSNGMSEENMKNITKSNRLFASTFVDHHILQENQT